MGTLNFVFLETVEEAGEISISDFVEQIYLNILEEGIICDNKFCITVFIKYISIYNMNAKYRLKVQIYRIGLYTYMLGIYVTIKLYKRHVLIPLYA